MKRIFCINFLKILSKELECWNVYYYSFVFFKVRDKIFCKYVFLSNNKDFFKVFVVKGLIVIDIIFFVICDGVLWFLLVCVYV